MENAENKLKPEERIAVVEVVTCLGFAIPNIVMKRTNQDVELAFDSLGHAICNFLEIFDA